LLGIAVFVPLSLLVTNRHKLLLAWVCITMSVHVFDTTVFTNLAAPRVVGLLYLPIWIGRLPAWLRLLPVRAHVTNMVYILFLAVIFGYMLPWPDTTGSRPFSLTAPGRAMVYPVRMIADFSLAVFIAGQLGKPSMLRFAVGMIIAGATISASFALVWLFVPQLDAYYSITGLRPLGGISLVRARGLSYEPRGLGMACAFGISFLLALPGRMSSRRAFALIANLVAFLAAFSSSAIALLGAGLGTAWLVGHGRARLRLVGAILLLLGAAVVGVLAFPSRSDVAVATIGAHFDGSRLGGARPGGLVERVAYALDSFDASTLLFLADNPQYAVVGTGPAMVMLPATEYLPPGLFSAMYGADGINGLPTHGLLLEIANSGIVGLLTWMVQAVACWAALSAMTRGLLGQPGSNDWELGRLVYAISVGFYLIQVSITSPYWSFTLGVGWAAAAAVAWRAKATAIWVSG